MCIVSPTVNTSTYHLQIIAAVALGVRHASQRNASYAPGLATALPAGALPEAEPWLIGTENSNAAAALNTLKCINSGGAALVGTGYSATTITVSNLANAYAIAHTDYLSTSTALSNTETYPYFTRTISSLQDISVQEVEAFANIGWKKIAVVWEDDSWARSLVEAYRRASDKLEVTIVDVMIPKKSTVGDIRELLRDMYATHDVHIYFAATFEAVGAQVLQAADTEGLLGEGFAWACADT